MPLQQFTEPRHGPSEDSGVHNRGCRCWKWDAAEHGNAARHIAGVHEPEREDGAVPGHLSDLHQPIRHEMQMRGLAALQEERLLGPDRRGVADAAISPSASKSRPANNFVQARKAASFWLDIRVAAAPPSLLDAQIGIATPIAPQLRRPPVYPLSLDGDS